MLKEGQLMCNICGIIVSASQAMQHVSTSTHELNKSMLEQELKAVRKEDYQIDSSVVVIWGRSYI
jgi:hypothetical protein